MRKTFAIIWVVSHLVAVLAGVLLLLLSENEIVGAVGVGIVGSGFVGLSLVAYVYLTHRTQERLENLSASGIETIFPYRSATIRSEYETRLATARKNIDIMGFGLSTLLDDFKDQFPLWERQATVRILLIDPDSPSEEYSFAKQRDLEEGDPPGTIREQVQAFAKEVGPLLEAGSNFKVRLYQSAPSVNYFRIDDVAFWGPYFVSMRSRNMPTLLVHRAGMLFGPLSNHFDEVWRSFSRELPDAWLRG